MAAGPRPRGAPLGVVLRRELLRLSRRPQTWIVRTLYSAFLLGFGVWILGGYLRGATDPSTLSRIGRNLFEFYAATQLAAAFLVAPILVASGVQEEREARTLDLLALTGVGAGRILFDQIASRLAVLLVVILSGAPFLAAVNSFGGFGPLEVVNAVYGAVAVAVILGNFAGFCALLTRGGPLVTMVLCAPYALVLFLIPAGVMELYGRDLAPIASPALAPLSDDPIAVLSAAIWLPALWSGWKLSVPVFRIVAGGDEADDEFGLLSPDIWAVERFKKGTWAWSLGAGFAGLVVAVLLDRVHLDRAVGFVLVWGVAALLLHAMHRLALVAVLLGSQRLGQLTRNPIRLFRRFQLGPRKVWPWPVAWREVVAGGSRTRLWMAVGLFWSLCALVALVDGLPNRHEWTSFAQLTGLPASLIGLVVAVGAVIDERRRGTLPLLWLTHLDPLHVARQKTAAPVLYALPLLGPCVLGLVHARFTSPTEHRWHHHPLGEPLLQGLPLVGDLLWLVFGLLFVGNLALVAAAAAGAVRSSRVAWPLALVTGFLWLTWPLDLALFLDVVGARELLDAIEPLAAIWYPLGWDPDAAGCPVGGLSRLGVAGTLLQFVLMPLLWRLLAGTLARA